MGGDCWLFLISYHSVFFRFFSITNSPTPTRVYSKKGSQVFPSHLSSSFSPAFACDQLESPVIVIERLERLYRHGDTFLRSGITFPMGTHSIVPSSCYHQSCWTGLMPSLPKVSNWTPLYYTYRIWFIKALSAYG